LDATGTTTTLTGITDIKRQLLYIFDYGDPGKGSWAASGVDRNADSGFPIGAHLYDTDAGYTVTLTVRAGHPWAFQSNEGIASLYKTNDHVTNGGNTYKALSNHTATSSFATDLGAGKWVLVQTGFIENSTTLGITATNTNSKFSGTNTVCISTSGNFSGAPSGAQLLTQSSVVGSPSNSKRYMYRGGETFTGDITFVFNQHDVDITSYGTGQATINNVVWANGGAVGGVYIDTCRVYNVVSQGGLGGNATPNKHSLVWNCIANANSSNTTGAVLFFGGYGDEDDLGIYDTVINGSDALNKAPFFGSVNWFGGTAFPNSHIQFMGNTTNRGNFHDFRMSAVQSSAIGHNTFNGGSGAPYHLIKLHGAVDGNQNSVPQSSMATRNVVIRGNQFGTSTTAQGYYCSADPQNTAYAEIVENVCVENNTFTKNNRGVVDEDTILGGKNLIARGNQRTDASTMNLLDGDIFPDAAHMGNPNTTQLAAYQGPYFYP